MRTLFAVLATTALVGGCSQDRGGHSESEALCASLLEYDGHRYNGHGELKRDPATTGRVDAGTALGCDDGNGAAPDRQVQVAELADVAMDRAVLVEGTVYVRSDLPFPKTARAWFVAPACDSDRRFELRGDWLSVKSPHRPRFDGDLRPPYRLGVHVTGGPDEYVGATIQVHVTERTDPALGSKDVKTSLWEGGGVVAQVQCEDGDFLANGLTSTPG